MIRKILFILAFIQVPLFGQTIQYTYLGSFGSSGNGEGELSAPHGISTDIAGNVYIADTGNHRIQKFDRTGNFILQRGGFGWSDNQFDEPVDIWAQSGLEIFVADKNGGKISRLDKDLNFISVFHTETESLGEDAFIFPMSITLSPQGDLFILEGENNKIVKMNFLGKIDFDFGAYDIMSEYLKNPLKIDISKQNQIYVSDKTLKEVLVFDYFGNFLKRIGGTVLSSPAGISFDDSGRIFIADSDQKTVFLFDNEGNLLYLLNSKNMAGSPSLEEPYDIAFYKNILYVLDRSINKVFLYQEIE